MTVPRVRLTPLVLCICLTLSARPVLAENKLEPSVPEWKIRGALAALQDPSGLVQAYALGRLRFLGAVDGVFGEAVRRLARDPNPRTLKSVAFTLGRMREDAGPYVGELATMLDHGDPSVVADAIRAFIEIGEPGSEFAPRIAELLDHEDLSVAMNAAGALASMGDRGATFAPRVAELLAHEDLRVVRSAVSALARMGDRGAAFGPRIAELLTHEDSRMVRTAAGALGRMGEPGAAYAPQIVRLLDSEDRRVVTGAIGALGSLGEHATAHVGSVARLLEEKRPGVAATAARALGRMGKAGKAHAPRLLELLGNEGNRLGSWDIGRALVEMELDDEFILPSFRQLLAAANASRVHAAASALCGLKERAAPLAGKVADLLSHPDPAVVWSAAEALACMGDDAAVHAPRIAALLGHERERVVWVALDTLKQMGESGAVFAPQVAELLKCDGPRARSAGHAAQALAGMGKRGAVYAPQIAALIPDEDCYSPSRFVEALGSMGSEGAAFAASIADLLLPKRPERYSSVISAIDALSRMGEHGAAYAARIASFLTHDDDTTARSAAEALRALRATDAQSVLATLEIVHQVEEKRRPYIRYLAYCHSGGDERLVTLIRWLGGADQRPELAGEGERRSTLQAFEAASQSVPAYPAVHGELLAGAAEIIRGGESEWRPDDVELLRPWAGRLTAKAPALAPDITRLISRLETGSPAGE